MFHRLYCAPRFAYAHGYARRARTNCTEPEQPRNPRGWFGYDTRSHSGRGDFGVRRPLRYLSYELDLDESQRRTIAALLSELKVAREQARLDRKKTTSALATLVADSELTVDALTRTLSPRVASAKTLTDAVANAVHGIVQTLDEDQRKEFAYMLSSGVLKL